MKHFLTFIRPLSRLLLVLAPVLALGAEPTEKTPNKYLFLVETSRAQSQNAERIGLAVADLIQHGLHGRMEPGDRFTIWTYNEKTDILSYPTETWDPAEARPISNRAFYHLLRCKYEKKGILTVALQSVLAALQSSPNLSIYLVYDGSQPLVAIPFAAEINSVLRTNFTAWRASQTPCVVALAIEQHRFVNWAVGVCDPPHPIQMVARMPEPEPTVLPKPAPSAPEKTTAKPIAPLEKAAPKPPPTTNSNKKATSLPNTAVVHMPPSPAPTPIPPPAPTPTTILPAVVTPPSAASNPVPHPVIQTPAPAVEKPTITSHATSQVAIPVPVKPAAEAITKPSPPAIAIVPPPSSEPAKPPVTTPSSIQVARETAIIAPVVISNSAPAKTTNAISPSLAVTAVPPGKNWLLYTGVIVLMAAAFGLGWLKRATTPAKPSLITKSMRQDGDQ